jgi:hypothetical protein
MTRVLRLGSALLFTLAFALGGCMGGESNSGTLVGPVTSVRDGRVCVGGPAASGDCFVSNAATSGLEVDDCVRVTYSSRDPSTSPNATEVQQLNRADHTDACPPS